MYLIVGACIYYAGISTWSIWCLAWCFAVHGIRRAKENL